MSELINKPAIIAKIAERVGNTDKATIEDTINAIELAFVSALRDDKKIILRKFGEWHCTVREGKCKNPRTGEALGIRSTRVVYFKPSKLIARMGAA
ncbi:HU family DNA-binding protein [Vibrio marisflavi]|uniref:Integration host factor subunit beta n=1 Tax=Vibrio marisflavi CECT 7928 TaxID=634439 RepID=A0ABN8E9J9_9VIBR|nr:HU family DNA-binding protein [Vibrio marisflavi]CAH0543158.1 Integration host factor subunit beta [Vibrio marisflavi CECT 7928]